MSAPDLGHALLVAQAAARDAGAILRENFWKPRTITDKGVNDLVTESDVASERCVSEALQRAFPHTRIAGEEGTRIGGGEWTWWIDPLDGTYNFVHGVPRFSVSIALVNGNRAEDVQVGVVYDPMFDEMFWAIRGRGAMRRHSTRPTDRIAVSGATRLRDALVASGFPASLKTSDNNTREWSAFVPLTQGMARMGSAALDLCCVACARFDVYWEYGLAPWDMGAGVLIAQEAGAIVSRYDGSPYPLTPPGGLLAATPGLHAEAVQVLMKARLES